MAALCRFLFFFGVIRPIALIILGLNVRRRHLLPDKGPAILAANHNSHLDTIVLTSLFPYKVAMRIRPVAAADYFLRNAVLAWFALNVMQIIPIDRKGGASPKTDVLAAVSEAIEKGAIVVIFPEGTRGEPEQVVKFRAGVSHLAKRHPEVPVVPVFLHGLGKALPKGEAFLVPFFCDVFVGESLRWTGDKNQFMEEVETRFKALAEEGNFRPWL